MRAAERVRRDAELSSTVSAGSSRLSLGHDRDPGCAHLLGPETGQVAIAEQHPSAALAQQPCDGEHHRRLAGAVGAEEGRHLRRRDLERDVATIVRPPRTVSASSQPAAGGRRSGLRRDRCRARSHVLLRAEVGAHHVLVPQHLGGRPGRDQLAEVEARPSSRSRPRRGSMSWSTRITSAPNCAGIRWIISPRRCVSLVAEGRLRARRGARRAGFAHHCARQLDEPPLAGAELPDLRLRRHVEPDELDRREHVGPPRGALRGRVLVDHRDVVEDRQLLDRLLGLERPSQTPARPRKSAIASRSRRSR